MPKFYSELQEASLENLASDPSGTVSGQIWLNNTENRIKTDDGTNKRALLRNDSKCNIGNNGTAANNIRLHRGASPVLQFVTGSDVTAEGTLSTSLAQISARQENYTAGTKPTFGNAGRLVWLTDSSTLQIDTGSAYASVNTGFSPATNLINPAVTPTVTVTSADNGTTYLVNSANGACAFNLPAPAANFFIKIKDIAGSLSTNNITINRNGSETLGGLAQSYVAEAPFGTWEITSAGTNYYFVGR